ncbi:GNAT family N-acetyltransferase [Aliikangiella sp. GXAS 311]|uniref:GNAT family N-acetyltransferase n=2 Tax=Aliikangiella maris TaxID=3162458 RepID=A0ABV2C0F6_9GAMM
MIEIKITPSNLVPKKLLLEADPSIDHINQYLADSICYVASIQNEAIGVCVLKPIDINRYELFNIAVSPENQKKGIGTQLLRYVIEHMKELNAKSVELGTGTFGYQLAFYQRFGFRVDSIHKDHFIDNYDEPIYENGIQLNDMLRLVLKL